MKAAENPVARAEDEIGPSAVGRRHAATVRISADLASMLLVLVKSLVLVPIYLRSFGLAAYGAWLGSGNLLALVAMLEGGFTLVYSQRLAQLSGQRDWEHFAREAFSGAAILTGAAVAVAALALAISPFVPGWVRVEGRTEHDLMIAFALSGLGVACGLGQTIFFAIFNSLQRPLTAGAIRLAVQVLEIVAIVVGLTHGLRLVALGVASLLSGVIGLLAAFIGTRAAWRAFRLPRGAVEPAALSRFARTAVPVFISRAGSSLVRNNEPLLTSIFLGPQAAAILGLTDRVFKNVQLVVETVGESLFYGIAHLHGEKPGEDRLRKVLSEALQVTSAFAAVVFAVAIAMNPDFVGLWVGRDRFGGQVLSLSVGLAALLSARGTVLGLMAAGLGANVEAAWCRFAELAVRIPLLVVLLPRLGILAVPIATLAASAGLSLWLYARLLAIRVGQRSLAQLVAWAGAGVPHMLLPISGALVAVRFRPHVTTWMGLILISAAAGLAAGLLVMTSPQVRQLYGRVLRGTRARWSSAESA